MVNNPESPHEPCYQIGEVSNRTGVTQRTLRFYEERGLLDAATRMTGGFRLYSEADIARVQRIKRLKSTLGLTLSEIGAMIQADETYAELEEAGEPQRSGDNLAALTSLIGVLAEHKKTLATKLAMLEEMRASMVERQERYLSHLADLQRSQGLASRLGMTQVPSSPIALQ